MDKTITPTEICRKSEMMYFFVNGFDMSGILVTVLRGPHQHKSGAQSWVSGLF